MVPLITTHVMRAKRHPYMTLKRRNSKSKRNNRPPKNLQYTGGAKDEQQFRGGGVALLYRIIFTGHWVGMLCLMM